MKATHSRAALLILMLFPGFIAACECSFGPLVDQTVRDAKRVMVVQLVSAEVSESRDGQQFGVYVKAKLRVVETLVGEPAELVEAWYSTYWCCGAKLDVGHFYVLFDTKGDAPVHVNYGNLFRVGGEFRSNSRFMDRLRLVVSGAQSLESQFGRYPSMHLSQMPPPRCSRPLEQSEK